MPRFSVPLNALANSNLTNSPPSLAGATNATVNELAAYTQAMAPRDTDLPAQTLVVSLVSGPSGLVLTNGVVAWTPTEAQGPSTNTISVRVTDGIATVTNAFSVVVLEVNAAPTLAGATNATVNELAGFTQALAPQDPDLPAQPLAVSLVSGPSGLVVTNGVVAWTPTEAQGPSTNTISVRVTDGVATVTNAFSVVVREVNTAPTLAGATNATVNELAGFTMPSGPGTRTSRPRPSPSPWSAAPPA